RRLPPILSSNSAGLARISRPAGTHGTTPAPSQALSRLQPWRSLPQAEEVARNELICSSGAGRGRNIRTARRRCKLRHDAEVRYEQLGAQGGLRLSGILLISAEEVGMQ